MHFGALIVAHVVETLCCCGNECDPLSVARNPLSGVEWGGQTMSIPNLRKLFPAADPRKKGDRDAMRIGPGSSA